MGTTLCLHSLVSRNAYLAAVPEALFPQLAPRITVVELTRSMTRNYGTPLADGFYFPLNSVITVERFVGPNVSGFIRFAGQHELLRIDEMNGLRHSRIAHSGYAAYITAPDFFSFARSFKNWQLNVVDFVETRSAHLILNAACLTQHSATQRVARFLLEATDAFPQGASLRFSHQHIAQLTYLRRETVTLILKRLVNAGAIRLLRGAVEVIDKKALRALACPCYRDTVRVAEALREMITEVFNTERLLCTHTKSVSALTSAARLQQKQPPRPS